MYWLQVTVPFISKELQPMTEQDDGEKSTADEGPEQKLFVLSDSWASLYNLSCLFLTLRCFGDSTDQSV